MGQPGIGAELKERARKLGPWFSYISGFGEMLPNPDNRVTLSATQKDQWGIPVVEINCAQGPNEAKMVKQILADGKAMIEAAGGIVVSQATEPGTPGLGIHEMGTARMGRDPKTSVLNKWNQAHEVDNLFITDGAAMTSSGCQNPSLTYMALIAHARRIMRQTCSRKASFKAARAGAVKMEAAQAAGSFWPCQAARAAQPAPRRRHRGQHPQRSAGYIRHLRFRCRKHGCHRGGGQSVERHALCALPEQGGAVSVRAGARVGAIG